MLPNKIEMSAVVEIEAAKDGETKIPTFKMNAYTGSVMRLSGWPHPVIIDIQGINVSAKSRPILFQHNPTEIIGHTSRIEKTGGGLVVEGVISGVGARAGEVVGASKNGFAWQASIGASPKKTVLIQECQEAKVNGQTIQGPAYHIKACSLEEVSFVALGADDDTSVTVAASAAENTEGDIVMGDENKPVVVPEVKATAPVVDTEAITKAVMAANADAESKCAAIRKAAGGNHEIAAQAMKENWSVDKTELAVLRAERAVAPAINSSRMEINRDILEVAACVAAGVSEDSLLKSYGEKTLEAAHKEFKGRMGLQQLMRRVAASKGIHDVDFNDGQSIRATFANTDISGILGTAANKRMLASYNLFPLDVDRLSDVAETRDFKSFTSYRLNETADFEEVAPGAPILQGKLEEESGSNQVKTYGKMIYVKREDVVNDDMSALTKIPEKIGMRAQARKVKAWADALIGCSLFTSGNSNVQAGSGYALGIDALASAEAIMMKQTDAAGDYIGLTPKFLVVPPALAATARQLIKSSLIVYGADDESKLGNANPVAGLAEVVVVPNINAAVTSGSDTTWYLFAEPMMAPLMQIAYLSGRKVPTMEMVDLPSEYLGWGFRCYFDFGVACIDKRGAVRSSLA